VSPIADPSRIFVSSPRNVVKLPDNGEGVSLHSVTVNDSYPDGNQGWTTVETVLLRFYTAYTPSGRFPVYLDSPIDVDERWMGYDAAVCVRKYEPWIIETYNATITSPPLCGSSGKGTAVPRYCRVVIFKETRSRTLDTSTRRKSRRRSP